MKARYAVLLAVAGVLLVTFVVDTFARRAYQSDVRGAVSENADTLAREISDVIARETAAVETLAAFVLISDGDPGRLADDFPTFAGALMHSESTIRSVQLAPGSTLSFVFPIEGNEAAVGLDLLADEDRKALLEPSIGTGATTVQGPVTLVQGGMGIIVRTPVHLQDGSFWGFAAVVLDWTELTGQTMLERSPNVISGIRLPGDGPVIAGSPAAFDGDPVIRSFVVGATDTSWEMATRPMGGWPTAADVTPAIWSAGGLVALVAGAFAYGVARRPEMLRKDVATALRHLEVSEARYQAIFEHAGVGIVISDATGRVVSVNPGLRSILGLDPDDEVLGDRVLRFVDSRDREAHVRRMNAAVETGLPVEGEVRLNGSRGTRWCLVGLSVIPGSAESDNLLIGVVADVTDRRLAEEALAESELRYRELFEAAPIGIQLEDYSEAIVILEELRDGGVADLRAHLRDHRGVLEHVLESVAFTANPTAALFQAGIAPGPEPKTLLQVLNRETESGLIESLVSVSEGVQDAEWSIDSMGADGRIRTLRMRWHVPEKDEGPDFSNLLMTITDVTELAKTEQRLGVLLESKNQFLASVAHELRTPLTAILGFAGVLKESSEDVGVDERREFESLIASHAQEMAHLIEDLLVLARTDTTEVPVASESIDLAAVVRDAVAGLPDARLRVDDPGHAVWANADPVRVRQIVRNLVTNAIRYGGDDLRVVVTDEQSRCGVEVSDDGPALAPEALERIFEPYERADAGAARPGSIGLGLTVSRSLARAQGGDLVLRRIDDRNVFRLDLPGVEIPRHALAQESRS